MDLSCESDRFLTTNIGDNMRNAEFCKNDKDSSTCFLCPNLCNLSEGQIGKCLSRKRENGKIKLLSYSEIVADGFDPIEKKPLYHVSPGSKIYSIGSFGCNLHCRFCQNYNISQSIQPSKKLMPEQLSKVALSFKNNIGVAFTYNEPGIWYEYIIDSAPILHKNGLLTVMVTNGYLSAEPWKNLCEIVDAVNIDLKAFTPSFYDKICAGKLETVKTNIQIAIELGVHVELTNLVVTGLNDNEKVFEEMVKWVSSLSKDIPFHISRYFPRYKEKALATDIYTLNRYFEMASKYLNYVYLGNVSGESNTICPDCGEIWIQRNAYSTSVLHNETCPKCGKGIPFLISDKVKNLELSNA